jgi:hypothetical protein
MHSTKLQRYVPHVAVATCAVLAAPALAASLLEATTGLPAIAGIALAVLLSLAIAAIGSALWMRHPGSRDLVFGDLMAWGWLRRMRSERRLAEATRVLGGTLSAGDRGKVLEQLAGSLEARDLYTHGHSRRVTRHAERIALGMGLPPDEVARVRTAAAAHDVGKVFTPREVLLKPGPLSDVEFEVIKRHAADGADMVADLGDREVTAIVRHHHERLDGSGYPDGLSAAEIPVGARIVAVADTFDAMTSARPYRRACSHKLAMDTLRQEAGVKLDADAVAAFGSYYRGRSLVALWSLIVNVPQRLVVWAGGVLQGGAATLGAAAVIGGGSLLGPGAAVQPHPEASLAKPAAGKTSLSHASHRREGARGRAAALASRGDGPRRLDVRRRSAGGPRPHFRHEQRGKQVPTGQPQAQPVRPPRPTAPPAPADPAPSAPPPVHVPPVKLPPVQVPPVQLPVQVPTVHLPPVQLPRVELPQLPGS